MFVLISHTIFVKYFKQIFNSFDSLEKKRNKSI